MDIKDIFMDNTLKYLVIAIAGFLIGFFFYDWFIAPETETSYKETIVVDTTYSHYMQRYKDDSLKFSSLSDSIEVYKERYKTVIEKDNVIIVHDSVFRDKPFESPLRHYSGSKPFLYGNMSYEATVAGSMLGIELFNDFKIPTITNTITKETQTVFKPSGLYATIGARVGDQQLTPLVGVTYLKNRSMVFYQYDLSLGNHQLGVGFKFLGR